MPLHFRRTTSALRIRNAGGCAYAAATTALRLGVLLSVTLAAAPASATSPFEGRYQGRGEGRLDLQVFESGDGSDAHLVIAETTIPNECTGEVRGLASRSSAGTLRLRKRSADAETTCEITLRYSPDYARVEMSADGCGDFHGTSCNFIGALKRR